MTLSPFPPPLPIEDHAVRLPDALTAWQRLQRRVQSILAADPSGRFVGADSRAVSLETLDRIRLLRATAQTTLRPRTKVTTVDGYERAEPSGPFWCVASNLTPDEGAGARVVQSETGDLIARGYTAYGVAVGLATMNEAYRRATSFDPGAVFRLVTGDARPQHVGYFGRQSGRWCASLQDPTVRALEAWRVASSLHGDGDDFTAGARRWDDGWTQDRLYRAGLVQHDALGIVRKWASDGWEWTGPIYEPDGRTVLIDPYRLMLFRFAGRKADVWRGTEAVRDGRARWGVK